MKLLLALLTLMTVQTAAWAEKFKSRIYEIEEAPRTGHPTLVKLENGRVVFLKAKDPALKALKSGLESGDLLEVEVNSASEFSAAQTLERGSGPQSLETRKVSDAAMMSYEPTVVSGPTAASSIFKRMKRGWQDDSQCYNRAHVWAYEEFRRSGLKSIKLFLFFTNRYIRNYRYKWWFHVSPMALVKEGEEVNRRVLDRRYTSGPRYVKNWTDNFIASRRNCPVVNKYSDYSRHQEAEDCYLIPVSQYFWQPRDIDRLERTGFEKTAFYDDEVDYAYWEAF